MDKSFNIVVATDRDNGIGRDGKLPWHLPGDMKFFRQLTTTTKEPNKKNAVVMGRKTWESISEKFRPLPGRVNVVLTRNTRLSLPADVIKAESLDQVFALMDKAPLINLIEKLFVIGGAQIYQEALNKEECARIYITQIFHTFDCDTFFPDYQSHFKRVSTSEQHTDGEISYHFCEYHRLTDKSSAAASEILPL